MAAGVLGVTPLTGVVTPFLSYGGSAMAANFAALGISARSHPPSAAGDDATPFRIADALARRRARRVAALGLVAGVVSTSRSCTPTTTSSSRTLASRPTEAAGSQYNPRVLDIVRGIPRGNVYDRRGLPLATGEREPLHAGARRSTAAAASRSNATCADPIERCYPLGGAAFHLLGDRGRA